MNENHSLTIAFTKLSKINIALNMIFCRWIYTALTKVHLLYVKSSILCYLQSFVICWSFFSGECVIVIYGYT